MHFRAHTDLDGGGVAPARARARTPVQSTELNTPPRPANGGRKDVTMDTNELTLSPISTRNLDIKDDELRSISEQIAACVNDMGNLYMDAANRQEAINKKLAPLFGTVKSKKLYERGGFKSLDEYAMECFNIKKSMAYMLANVGEQFYLVDNEYTRKARETLSTSKLAELKKTDRVAIAAAVDSGELTSDTSTENVRNFAARHVKPGKERVLPTFTVVDMRKTGVFCENVTKEDMYEQVAASIVANYPEHAESEAAVFFSTAKLDGDKASAAQHFIAYTATGFVRMYEYRPYVKKAAKSEGKRPSIADILKSLSVEEVDLLRSMVERGEHISPDSLYEDGEE